jgi:hypothetical protein
MKREKLQMLTRTIKYKMKVDVYHFENPELFAPFYEQAMLNG